MRGIPAASRHAVLNYHIRDKDLDVPEARSRSVFRSPGGRISARRLNASLMSAPSASVSLICKAGTSFEILVSASALSAREAPGDRQRLRGTDVGFISILVSGVGPQRYHGGKGSGEVRVNLGSQLAQARGVGSRGRFRQVRAEKLPTSDGGRAPPWSSHTPEGDRTLGQTCLPKGTNPSLVLHKACRKDFRPLPRWPPAAVGSFGCGAEGHWEGAEPPLPKFRLNQDWRKRVQLGLCRICVAVPALFGRGSPLKET